VYESLTPMLRRAVCWAFRAQLRSLGLKIEEDLENTSGILSGYTTSHPDVLFPSENGEMRLGKMGSSLALEPEHSFISNIYLGLYSQSKSLIFRVRRDVSPFVFSLVNMHTILRGSKESFSNFIRNISTNTPLSFVRCHRSIPSPTKASKMKIRLISTALQLKTLDYSSHF
jgi:hypothetical protein